MPAGYESRIDEVTLNEVNFAGCQACGEAPTDGYCLVDDAAISILDQLAACDCLLVGTPLYFDTVSAQLKAIIDRSNCFRHPDWEGTNPDHRFVKKLDRQRPGAMVIVGGEDGWFEGARRIIAGFFKWVEVVNSGKLIWHSQDFHDRGAAAHDDSALAEAAELGRTLAAEMLRLKRASD